MIAERERCSGVERVVGRRGLDWATWRRGRGAVGWEGGETRKGAKSVHVAKREEEQGDDVRS